jgi:hypothetical protein
MINVTSLPSRAGRTPTRRSMPSASASSGTSAAATISVRAVLNSRRMRVNFPPLSPVIASKPYNSSSLTLQLSTWS